MANDPLEPVRQAEAEIATRAHIREKNSPAFRGPLAAELIADDLTRVAAELKVMRGLLAIIAAKMK